MLKKQSRPKAKRLNASTGATAAPSPLSLPPATSKSDRAGTPGGQDDEEAMDIDDDATNARSTPPPALQPPVMYRWISSSRPVGALEAGTSEVAEGLSRKLVLSFSVPPSVIPEPEASAELTIPTRAAETPACDVDGCQQPRKYRLVSNWTTGACGMVHLKVLST